MWIIIYAGTYVLLSGENLLKKAPRTPSLKLLFIFEAEGPKPLSLKNQTKSLKKGMGKNFLQKVFPSKSTKISV